MGAASWPRKSSPHLRAGHTSISICFPDWSSSSEHRTLPTPHRAGQPDFQITPASLRPTGPHFSVPTLRVQGFGMHAAYGFSTEHYVAATIPQESTFQSLVWLPKNDSLASEFPWPVPAHGVGGKTED